MARKKAVPTKTFYELVVDELDELQPPPLERAIVDMLARALVAEPENASLWKQFKQELAEVRGANAEDDALAQALKVV